MKNKLITLLVFTVLTIGVVAQNPLAVCGKWYTAEKKSVVEIVEKDGVFYGTILKVNPVHYVNGEPKKDKENPDPALRNRSREGIEILKDFSYNSKDDQWTDGTIYDPESGKTYSCYMRFTDEHTLKVKWYVAGIKWLGRSTEWVKVESEIVF